MTTAYSNLANYIDHTLLKPTATEQQIQTLCDEAIQHSFYSVCIHPRWLPLVSKKLNHQKSVPITVVGFPLGANLTQSKVNESDCAIQAGAREIDMVIDLSAAKDGDWLYVENDIRQVAKICGNIPVKVILETCYLTQDEIINACKASVEAGAAFVKTSTGFGTAGANTKDIQLMRETVGKNIGVKASGGIRTYQQAVDMIEAGATRIGASASVEIMAPA